MSALGSLLRSYRDAAMTEREKGSYFEELIRCYLKNEASYQDLYSDVWTYAEWAKQQGLDARDTGIDLVAKTRGTDEFHAIQCKLYDEDYRLQKSDIDSFFTASGKRPFTHRVIVSTTNHWSEHAEDALRDQQPPVSKIDLFDLENSQIDWSKYQLKAVPVLKQKKELRPHQISAVRSVREGLAKADRGKLIMACGTGKTFTALKIAEELAGKGGRVLFLVPSLNLLSQTLTEWTQESAIPLHNFAVCSDSDVGKKRKKDDDTVQTFTHELRYPATTDAARLAAEIGKRHDGAHMSVVYSTYHSIDVISRAQNDFGLEDFDLVVCDEAHRTTGATFDDEDESAFIRVHDNAYIRAGKRLYMTATPRIYGEAAKATAEKDNVALCSMDNEGLYGKQLHVVTFSTAVKLGLLCDYKVIVLAVEESHVSRRIQSLLKDPDNQLRVDDAAKIIGCWKALSKQGLSDELQSDPNPMRRAVAFCQVIELARAGRTHKVSSKQIAGMFQAVVQAYQEKAEEDTVPLTCEAEHVDGSMNASEKEAKLQWLKDEAGEDTCRILSNVRCLSEGVDVPALDAVLFLTPRNSQIDVVQSVGRVMRNAPGKQKGYVILPVVIPAGVEPHEALNDNTTYKVVWQVLQALRSHDDRFDAMVNKLEFIGKDTSKMEVIAITDKVERKQKRADKGKSNEDAGRGGFTIGKAEQKRKAEEKLIALPFEVGEFEKAIYAKLVQKVGNRHHWEEWANDIAQIARTHIDRINGILENPGHIREREAFEEFAKELRDDLNDSISDGEIVETLAQHLITKPVFDALFADHHFTQQNPISIAMDKILDALQEHRLDKEASTLQGFYDSVKLRASGIDNAVGKQRIIVELYDKFFANAFPRLRDKLGIVYTPVEAVDFIIHSVNDVLQKEFGQTLGSKGVHILDPFTGTGTFITRLLQSGLIKPEELEHKYLNEIHANEIVLLAYYIAAVNIEAAYHALADGEYKPFEGICLTDTFQMYEKEDLVSVLMEDNSERRKRQKELDIRVIIGNPPYSSGQDSANDNNQKISYPHLDGRIRETYANRSVATLKNSLYNSYIRAIRWASDRIGESGIIGFVSASGFIDKSSMDGLRKCLADEFTSIYVINLRGDIRKNMLSKGRAKEGQNFFGSGSMTGIAISLFIKSPGAERGNVYYHDIGNDLSSQEKRNIIEQLGNISGITAADGWRNIEPDAHGDWLNQRDNSFSKYIPLGGKKEEYFKLFETFSPGVSTNRDAWCYNSSKKGLLSNMERMIDFYNKELDRFNVANGELSPKVRMGRIDDFVDSNPSEISWSVNLKQELAKNRRFSFDMRCLVPGLYRPFSKQWLYFDRVFNERVLQMPKMFPSPENRNRAICISGIGARSGFSVLMADTMVNRHTLDTGQCFPFYIYEEGQYNGEKQGGLFDNGDGVKIRKRRDALTDEGLAYFQKAYHSEQIGKEDVFYYIYGLLHSPDYRERYADNLMKVLPRIPCVKTVDDFWAFSKAGRALAELHLNYESVAMYPAKIEGDDGKLPPEAYRVVKMKYAKKKVDGKIANDLSTIQYNSRITVSGVPEEAYEYVVNGKSAIDWVMERQCVKTDKASGIVNDANDWAIETMHNPRYPLELLLRVITVSIETMKIVKMLPTLDAQAG